MGPSWLALLAVANSLKPPENILSVYEVRLADNYVPAESMAFFPTSYSCIRVRVFEPQILGAHFSLTRIPHPSWEKGAGVSSQSWEAWAKKRKVCVP